MKVILLADVYKHGVAGEVINVSDGFARNWLLPKKLAMKASPGALRQAETLRSQAATRRAALDNRLNDLAHQIDGVELFFGRRASPTGKLFGSVTTTEIADELNKKTGIDINRRRISQMSVREIGTHEIPVRLGSESSPVLRVIVMREDEYANFLAQGSKSSAVPEEASTLIPNAESAAVESATTDATGAAASGEASASSATPAE